MKTELWIARDKDGDLFLFQEKPKREHDYWVSAIFIKLNAKSFPNVKWDDKEPKKVELTLIEGKDTSKEVKEIVRVGYAKHIALLGYTRSESIMFPSSAQMQIYDTDDKPFEDCTEAYVDFLTEKQVDNLIEALKKVKDSFKTI